jgi:hypothetical protein
MAIMSEVGHSRPAGASGRSRRVGYAPESGPNSASQRTDTMGHNPTLASALACQLSPAADMVGMLPTCALRRRGGRWQGAS